MAIVISSRKSVFFSFLSIFIIIAITMLFSVMFLPSTANILKDAEHEQILIADSNVLFLKNNYFETTLRMSTRNAILSYIDAMNSEGDYLIDCFDDAGCADDYSSLQELNVYLKRFIVVGSDTMDFWNLPGNRRFSFEDGSSLIGNLNLIRNIFMDEFQMKIDFIDSSGNPWPTDDDGQLFLNRNFIESEIMPNLNIEQNRAFTVRVNFTTSFLISVRDGAASWLYEDHLMNVDVSLSGLPDPLYVMKTKRTFGSDWQFNNTIIEDSKPIRTRQETLDFYRRMYYSAAPGLGPSYFQRLVNSRHTSDCCGIESFVNVNRIFSDATVNQTLTALPNNWFNRSNVDHKYFYYNIPRGENLFSCREIIGQNERQLYSFASLESPFGNPTFFNLDTFYAERYSFPEHFGGSLCQFSRECLLDASCTPQQTPTEE